MKTLSIRDGKYMLQNLWFLFYFLFWKKFIEKSNFFFEIRSEQIESTEWIIR